jgi:hypothetical protein
MSLKRKPSSTKLNPPAHHHILSPPSDDDRDGQPDLTKIADEDGDTNYKDHTHGEQRDNEGDNKGPDNAMTAYEHTKAMADMDHQVSLAAVTT